MSNIEQSGNEAENVPYTPKLMYINIAFLYI